MTVKAVKTARKPAKNNGFHERRLGVMQTHRKREEQPSYARLLQRFRLIDKNYSGLQNAWHVWQLFCADRVVIRLSMALAAKKKQVHLPSVAEPYQNGARVLAVMSERQLAALKQRLGVSCATR